MDHFTTDVYKVKRDIITFSKKISHSCPKPLQKFSADILFGILASQSCLLTEISASLKENCKKINTVDRLSRHLASGIPIQMLHDYLLTVRRGLPHDPVVHIDDSDVIKPSGFHFEALGYVRDGSASENGKAVIRKGYHVTEACVLSSSGHPVSIFSEIHSSREKTFSSINSITFSAIDRAVALLGHATFCMDRGYADNKIFNKLSFAGQDFIIRLRRGRKVLYHGKYISVDELCARRKGKVKMPLFYDGKKHDAYLSHVQVRISASKEPLNLVLLYGISEHPMMLATNKTISSKDDILQIARTYLSRWRIEEYFRAKKQIFGFEYFRVRSLTAMNALNFFLTAAMTYLGLLSDRPETSDLKVRVISRAAPIRGNVCFLYYRVSSGIASILAYAKAGVRSWFKIKRPKYRQMRLSLIC